MHTTRYLEQVLQPVELDELVHFANQVEVFGIHLPVYVILEAVDLVLLCSVEQSLALKDTCDPEMRPVDYGEFD